MFPEGRDLPLHLLMGSHYIVGKLSIWKCFLIEKALLFSPVTTSYTRVNNSNTFVRNGNSLYSVLEEALSYVTIL